MTIDTKKLRELAIAAIPIPIGNMVPRQQLSECSKAWLEFNSQASPAAVIELLDAIDALRSEKLRQAQDGEVVATIRGWRRVQDGAYTEQIPTVKAWETLGDAYEPLYTSPPLQAEPPMTKHETMLTECEYHCIGFIDVYSTEIKDKSAKMKAPRAVYVRSSIERRRG